MSEAKIIDDETTLTPQESEEFLNNLKKIQKQISEIIRQIEASTLKCRQVEDLFATDLLTKRMKLKDLCEKLMCTSPKTHGLVARDKYWRYGLYDVINIARSFKKDKPWKPLELAYMQNHLLNGIGQFNCLLIKLEDLADQNKIFRFVPNGVDNILTGELYTENIIEPKNLEEVLKSNKWVLSLFLICTINIGDLYRYLYDIYLKCGEPEQSQDYYNRAQDYYQQAFLLNPESGTAHNQLGNLSVKMNRGIDSAYYFLYSLNSPKPFEGVLLNLKQHLDKKIVEFVRRPASQESNPMDIFCNSFINLIFHLLFEDLHIAKCEKIFQDTISNFYERLATYDPDIDEKFLFHITSISVFTIWRNQTTDSNNTPNSIGFALSVFAGILNHLATVLEQHKVLYIEEKVEEVIEEIEEVEDLIDFSEKSEKTKSNHSKKRIFSNGLGARRRLSGSSEEENEEDEDGDGISIISDEDSEYEYEEIEIEEEYYSEEIYSDSECEGKSLNIGEEKSEKDLNGKAFDSTSSSGNSQKFGEDNKILASEQVNNDEEAKKEKFIIKKEDLMKCWKVIEPVLVAIAPYIGWLQVSPHIRSAFAANCEKDFLSKLCETLNLLNGTNWANELPDLNTKIMNDWKAMKEDPSMDDIEKKLFRFELPEDRSLLGLFPFKELFKGMENLKPGLTTNDLMVVRIARFLNFGHWLSGMDSFQMIYCEDEEKFLCPSAKDLELHLRKAKIKKLLKTNHHTNPALEKMAKLYKEMSLQLDETEKKDFKKEQHFQRQRQNRDEPANYSHIAIIDLPAFLNYFKYVKKLAMQGRFAIVVPRPIWMELDRLKDVDEEEDSRAARTASRWLERSLKGHLGIRSQRDFEKIPLDMEYPTFSKKNNVEKDFFDMMEYSNFLLKKMAVDHVDERIKPDKCIGDIRDKYKVFYLTGCDDLAEENEERSFNPFAISKFAGIFFDHIAVGKFTYPPRFRRRIRRRRKTHIGKG